MVCMGAGFTLLGVFALLVAVMLVRDQWQFLTDGVQAVGRVTGKEMRTETRRDGPESVYELLYAFQDAGQTMHTGHDQIPADTWVRAKPGALAVVQYVAADPTINRITRSELPRMLGALIAAPVGGILLALGIFLLGNRKLKIRT
jgi:hypothetical protein